MTVFFLVLAVFPQHVHHAGQPMPGEEQEDIVMTSTQCSLLNITCPLSGKPVTELAEPVRRYITEPYNFMFASYVTRTLLLPSSTRSLWPTPYPIGHSNPPHLMLKS